MSQLQFLAGRTDRSATASRRRDFFRPLPHLVLNLVPALHVECFGLVLQAFNLKLTLWRPELRQRREACQSWWGGGLR